MPKYRHHINGSLDGLSKLHIYSKYYFPGTSGQAVAALLNLTFKLLASGSNSGIGNLTTTLTVNGTTMLPVCRFEGKDATTSSWVPVIGGTTLNIAQAGNIVSASQYTPFTNSTEKAVRFNKGQIYQAPNNSAYDISGSTDDYFFECVFQHNSSGGESTLFAKYSAGGRGPLVLIDSLNIYKGYGMTPNTVSDVLANGSWNYLFLAIDRNGNCYRYLNDPGGPATAASPNVAETTAVPFALGAYLNTGGKSNASIALFQMWRAAGGTINTVGELTEISANRFARLTGVYPQVAAGRATPSTRARATAAHLDTVIDETTGERRLFLVPQKWPRVVKRKTADNQYLVGYLSEAAVTNFHLYSSDFTNAYWTKTHCTISTASITDPFGSASLGIVPTAGANRFASFSTGTYFRSSTLVSAMVKPGVNNYCYLYGNGNQGYCIYELTGTGSIATIGSNDIINTAIEYYGNSWYKVSAEFNNFNRTIVGTTNVGNNVLYTESTGSNVGLWVSYVQEETKLANQSVPGSSYIKTTTAAASRGADNLVYDVSGNFTTGSMALGAKYLSSINSASLGTSGSILYFGLNFNAAELGLITDGRAVMRNSSYGQYNTLQSVNTNTIQQLNTNFIANNVSFYANGALQSSSATVTVPPTGSFDIGWNYNTINKNTNVGIIGDIKIYDGETTS